MVWIELQGFLELSHRLVQPFFVIENNSQIVVSSGKFRVDLDRPLKMSEGIVQLTLPIESNAPIIFSNIVVRIEFQGFLVTGDCLIQLAFLAQNQPEMILAYPASGVLLQRAAPKRVFALVSPSLLPT